MEAEEQALRQQAQVHRARRHRQQTLPSLLQTLLPTLLPDPGSGVGGAAQNYAMDLVNASPSRDSWPVAA